MIREYLGRIGYDGPVSVDGETLTAIHRAHALAVPYENLEIQFGRENLLDEGAFHDKIVDRGRGGWCYEMNGMLTWALGELGFDVTRVAGAVGREFVGSAADANHMVGLVDLDRRYVVDVGLGDGPLEPFPLAEREWDDAAGHYRLERLDEEWWRFHNDPNGMAHSYDFTEHPVGLTDYQETCTRLQTDPESTFVKFAIVSRRHEDGYEAIRDTTHLDVRGGELDKRYISDLDDYANTLARCLGGDLGAEVETLWDIVGPRAAARAAEREQAR